MPPDRGLHQRHGVTHGDDGLGGVIGNLDVEFFLEGHDQIDRVEAVGAGRNQFWGKIEPLLHYYRQMEKEGE